MLDKHRKEHEAEKRLENRDKIGRLQDITVQVDRVNQQICEIDQEKEPWRAFPDVDDENVIRSEEFANEIFNRVPK